MPIIQWNGWHIFLLYRKLRKSSKIVYNKIEIKNDMAKERSEGFAMTLFMVFFVSWLGCTV